MNKHSTLFNLFSNLAKIIKSNLSLISISPFSIPTAILQLSSSPLLDQFITNNLISYINNTRTIIPSYAFQNCTNLSTLELLNCNIINTEAFALCNSLSTVRIPLCSTIGKGAFRACQSLN